MYPTSVGSLLVFSEINGREAPSEMICPIGQFSEFNISLFAIFSVHRAARSLFSAFSSMTFSSTHARMS
jgi:hypothetical protein